MDEAEILYMARVMWYTMLMPMIGMAVDSARAPSGNMVNLVRMEGCSRGGMDERG